MKSHWFAPMVLAAGIIVSTLVATLTSESRWLVLAGPLVMAIALVVVKTVDHRLDRGSRFGMRVALIFGASIVLASVLLAQRDPGLVAEFLPSYGGVVAILMGVNPRKRRSRCC